MRHVFTVAALSCAVGLLASIAAQAQNYTLTTVASFDGEGNGANPHSNLVIDSQGNVYGATTSGGADSQGTIFKIAADTNTITTLATTGSSYALALANGFLYGVHSGTLFKCDTTTGGLTSITPPPGTGNYYGGLAADAQGNVYGAAGGGGSAGYGVIYKIPSGSNSAVNVASFDPRRIFYSGRYPSGDLVMDNRGVFYGVCTHVGIPSTGPSIFTYSGGISGWDYPVGSVYPNSLLPDNTGGIYATIYTGGAYNKGAIVRLTPSQSTYSILTSFNGTNGSGPDSLTFDSNGNIWGTTYNGGPNDTGGIFMFSPSTNSLTTFNFFNGTNGANPVSRLVFDSYGNAYGTTSSGGANGLGTVFKLTSPTGAAAPEPGSLALLLLPAITGFTARRMFTSNTKP